MSASIGLKCPLLVRFGRPVSPKGGESPHHCPHFPRISTSFHQLHDNQAGKTWPLSQARQPVHCGGMAAEDVNAHVGVQKSHALAPGGPCGMCSAQALDLVGVKPVGAGLGALAQATGEVNTVADVSPVGPHPDQAALLQLGDQFGSR
jgi:hypothetical protein